MRRGKSKLNSTISNYWHLVTSTILSSAATSTTISSLTGDTAKEYRILFRAVNGYAGANVYSLRPNNDSGSNYGHQNVTGNSGTMACSRNTSATGFVIGEGAASGDMCISEIFLHAASGYRRLMLCKHSMSVSGTTVTQINDYASVWNNTANEITSLVFLSNQTNGLGIGTQIIIYRRVP